MFDSIIVLRKIASCWWSLSSAVNVEWQLGSRSRLCCQWQPMSRTLADNDRSCCVNLSFGVCDKHDLCDQPLAVDAAKMLVQAFISSCLNAVITDNFPQRLQSVQNAAAGLITRTCRRQHITPNTRSTDYYADCPSDAGWSFKTATLMFSALNGLTPPYLDSAASWSVTIRRLRSSLCCTCPRLCKELRAYDSNPVWHMARYKCCLLTYLLTYVCSANDTRRGWGTDHSQPPVHESGTLCRLRCDP